MNFIMAEKSDHEFTYGTIKLTVDHVCEFIFFKMNFIFNIGIIM